VDFGSIERVPAMMIDLMDWELGSLCLLCGDQDGHRPATLRDSHVGPVCDDCMVECLRADRVLRSGGAA
jgi:hypothetical protein